MAWKRYLIILRLVVTAQAVLKRLILMTKIATEKLDLRLPELRLLRRLSQKRNLSPRMRLKVFLLL